MATPVKSPLQKRHKGDEPTDDDLIITSVSEGEGGKGVVSLRDIERLLDKKLDPLNNFLQQIHLGLGAFKALSAGSSRAWGCESVRQRSMPPKP